MPKVLLEDSYRFAPDPAFLQEHKLIGERVGGARTSPQFPMEIPGLLSEMGVINGNNRRYSMAVWQNQLKEGATLRRLMDSNDAWGRLEHPTDGIVPLSAPISHLITGVYIEGQQLKGRVRLANTPEGQRIWAMMECGWVPLLSSRGFGSVVRASDGVDDVQEDFVCEGWDFVRKPSFANCKLDPDSVRSSLAVARGEAASGPQDRAKDLFALVNGAVASGLLRAESVRLEGGVVVVGPALTENYAAISALPDHTLSITSTPPSAPATKVTTMSKITEIRESISSLRAQKPADLAVVELTRGLAQMESLHRQLVETQVEEPKSAYDVDVSRRELTALENQWREAADAPKAEAKTLRETQDRLVRVAHRVTKHALGLRTKLGEALVKARQANESLKDTVRKGQGWMQRAEAAESELGIARQRLEVAYEALDQFASRYARDITRVGASLLQKEFTPDADTVKAIKEAKRPSDLVKIRTKLESLRKGMPVAAPIAAAPVAAPSVPAAAPMGESRLAVAGPIGNAPLGASAVAPIGEVTVTTFTRTHDIEESVAMVGRHRDVVAESRNVAPTPTAAVLQS